MSEETTQEATPEIIDLIPNPQPQTKAFPYKVKLPDGQLLNIAVIAMSSDDARESLKQQLPENSEIHRIDTVIDFIIHAQSAIIQPE